MIAINKTLTETINCDGAKWEIRYRRENGDVICTAILELYDGETKVKTIDQPVPAEIYEAWASDDSVIQDWLFEANGI